MPSEILAEYQLGPRTTITPGVVVHVGPSAEGKRDGFDGRVKRITRTASGVYFDIPHPKNGRMMVVAADRVTSRRNKDVVNHGVKPIARRKRR
jgi:hypothetical protein